MAIFLKEQTMCHRYASYGFQLEHLYEEPGTSSPDVEVKRHGSLVMVEGKLGDLKRLSSTNNIYKEGKEAIFKKGADIVMFEFTNRFPGIKRELQRLADKHIHGYYYYTDEDKYYSF